MPDDQETLADRAFVRELRRVLKHLYDPLTLRRSPLRELIAPEGDSNPGALRQTIARAIENLRPSASVAPQSEAWLLYRILSHRYIDQFTQGEVALNLRLSIRTMRRWESKAVRALADTLWNRYRLAACRRGNLGFHSPGQV